MKLITLNLWGGKIFEPLMEFLKREAPATDIFCFQEMYHGAVEKIPGNKSVVNLFTQLQAVLSEFDSVFTPVVERGVEGIPARWGLATFVRQNISVADGGKFFVYRTFNSMDKEDPQTIPRCVQYFHVQKDGASMTVCNFHGLYNATINKLDNPDRLEQSRKIRAFLDTQQGPLILCGDFNLRPETESIKMLEGGMRNLIKEYGITSTRSHYYSKDVRFADYILVTPDIKVQSCKVLPDVVSDHLAIMLEFSLQHDKV